MPNDPNLEKVVSYVVTAENDLATLNVKDGSRLWLNFSQGLPIAGQFDFETMHQIFSREFSNNEYLKGRAAKSFKAKDVALAKLSIEILAGFERDYRLRTRSRVRSIAHGLASAQSNGQTDGAVRRNLIDWLSRISAEQEPAK